MNNKDILGIVVTFMILSLTISAVALAKKPAGKPYEATFSYTIDGDVDLVGNPVSNQAGTEFYDKDDVPKRPRTHGYWRSGYIGQYSFDFSLPEACPILPTDVVDLRDVYHYRHYDSAGDLEEDYWGITLIWETGSDDDGIIETLYLLAETDRNPEPEGDFDGDVWTVENKPWSFKVKAQQCEKVKGRGRTKWVCTTTGFCDGVISITLTVDKQ